jgi:peptide/nickel transport system permease protein
MSQTLKMNMPHRLGWLTLLTLMGYAWLAPPAMPAPHLQDLSSTLQAPSPQHWLGTDALGRSVLARLAEGIRVSLSLALGSALLSAVLGASLGVVAAWRRGWLARVLQSLADAVMAMPGLLWVLLLSALAPGEKWPLYMGLVLTAWVEFFRTTRASVGALLAGPQVQSSRLLGFGPAYIARYHLWPAMRSTWLTLVAFAVCNSVLAVAAMGFVGIGLRPPGAELGVLMTEALPYSDDAPWLLAAPVLALLACVLALQAVSRPPAEQHS